MHVIHEYEQLTFRSWSLWKCQNPEIVIVKSMWNHHGRLTLMN